MLRSRATLGHLAHPADIEKAAKDHPDISFIIYHSAMKHGPDEPRLQDRRFNPGDRRLRLARRADEDQASAIRR